MAAFDHGVLSPEILVIFLTIRLPVPPSALYASRAAAITATVISSLDTTGTAAWEGVASTAGVSCTFLPFPTLLMHLPIMATKPHNISSTQKVIPIPIIMVMSEPIIFSPNPSESNSEGSENLSIKLMVPPPKAEYYRASRQAMILSWY